MTVNHHKIFTLYWRDGKRETVNGNSIAEALTIAGYGNGSVRALDFYASGDNHKYVWVSEVREWKCAQ